MSGYDELSTLIGSYPELAIFRRFGPLAAKVLLSMQADLLNLEEDLDVASELAREDVEKREILRSWAKTNDAGAEAGADLRKRKIVEAREKLDKYYSFLLKVTEVMKIQKPERRNLESLRRWLASEQGGNHFLAGAGVEARAWDQDGFDDMLSPKTQNDRFAQWIINTVIPTYHRRIGHWFHKKINRDDLGDLWHYRDEPFIQIGNVVCILLSSLLPSCCIFALYFVRETLIRLILIACFDFVFSIVMTFVVQARRQDIFAATTALAAVQVVFVGGIEIVYITKNGTQA